MEKFLHLTKKMVEYERNCPERINHFLKVNAFAKIIAKSENLDENTLLIIDAVTILHDIGIKISLEKHNSSAGKYQEIEGPSIAEKLLSDLSFPQSAIDRICFLIANHHTYDEINGIDYQILIEADFLVNIFENNLNKDKILNIKDEYFKTESGQNLLDEMYILSA